MVQDPKQADQGFSDDVVLAEAVVEPCEEGSRQLRHSGLGILSLVCFALCFAVLGISDEWSRRSGLGLTNAYIFSFFAGICGFCLFPMLGILLGFIGLHQPGRKTFAAVGFLLNLVWIIAIASIAVYAAVAAVL